MQKTVRIKIQDWLKINRCMYRKLLVLENFCQFKRKWCRDIVMLVPSETVCLILKFDNRKFGWKLGYWSMFVVFGCSGKCAFVIFNMEITCRARVEFLYKCEYIYQVQISLCINRCWKLTCTSWGKIIQSVYMYLRAVFNAKWKTCRILTRIHLFCI